MTLGYSPLPELNPIRPTDETCRACGACCLGTANIWLTRESAAVLRSAGTLLSLLHEEGGLWGLSPSSENLYQMNSPCGYLEVADDGLYSCSIYGQPQRPRACSATMATDSHCVDVFGDDIKAAYLDLPPDYPAIDLLDVLQADLPLPTDINLAA